MKNTLAALTMVAIGSAVLAQDGGKKGVEQPILRRLGGTAGRVEPGQVIWHASFDAAQEAAAKSGKPVLLFQLLGRLDEEWC